jgi:hypothetical protein
VWLRQGGCVSTLVRLQCYCTGHGSAHLADVGKRGIEGATLKVLRGRKREWINVRIIADVGERGQRKPRSRKRERERYINIYI